MPPKVEKCHFQNEWWQMKNIQIMFKQFQKIDQELNAWFVKLRLTFQIYI